MQYGWIEKQIQYDGTQLRSGWIREVSGLERDAIVVFQGGADVPVENMVDLEDVAAHAPIFSEEMLHFIVEIHKIDLETMVLWQRLLIVLMGEMLHRYPKCKKIIRRGDDLYDEKAKLSVSIATRSPQSCLIHTGLNISSQSTPLPTQGLADYGIDPRSFGELLCQRFITEWFEIQHATQKVRSVD